MVKFNLEFIEMFLGVVRKYMQLRGGLSQKDLAVAINVGISTMSRFINQKTKEYDAQMIASMVAYLNIPLHEIIDFIEEDSTPTFKKLVSFYKESNTADEEEESSEGDPEMASFEEGLEEEETKTKTSASIKGIKVPFGAERRAQPGAPNLSIRDKLNQLSPRQKGFLTEFLDLDVEGRDLIVDVGKQLFTYFKQSRANF
jgi:transcriptional regulator with XRE-family HTH domain